MKRNRASIELNSITIEDGIICDSERIQIISIAENYPEELNTFVNRNAYSKYISDILNLYNDLVIPFKENGKLISVKIEKYKTVISVSFNILVINKEKIIQISNITKIFGDINTVKMNEEGEDAIPAISEKIKQSFINNISFTGDLDNKISKFILLHSKKHIPYMTHFINPVAVSDRLITKEPTFTSMLIVSYCHDKIIQNYVNNKVCCLNSYQADRLH